jgi:hypothetical protein
MVTSSQAYVIAYAEVGSTVDGWSTTDIGGDFPASGGGPFDPVPPPTTWTISWFTVDGSTLATVDVNAQTGTVAP